MSKIVRIIAGTIAVAVGIITGNPALIRIGATLLLGALLGPKTPARSASEMAIQLGEQPRTALLGECFAAGSLVDAFNYGGKYGTDWECQVIRLADHRCHSLTGYYVNDKYVAWAGDGVQAGFNGQLKVYFRAATSVTALPADLTANWPGYTAGDVGRSGCDVIVFYKADSPDAKNPVWPGGRPRFGWVVKGKLCYDPRLDSSVGGSGAHRWDAPGTWTWSENLAVCRYNWVRGIFAEDGVGDPSALLVGRGLSAAEAPPANLFAAANLCDEVVDGAARYRCAGPVYAEQSFLEVEEMFQTACGGMLVTREGSVELEPGAAKSVVAVFTDADLLEGSKVSWNEAMPSDADPEWVNTVIANYVEPAQQWNQHDAPVARDVADLLADGGPREANLGMRLVRWVNQAQRVAEIARRLGRLWGRGKVTLGPRFCEIEEGDWVQWQSDRRFGGATRTFRVDGYSIDEKWQNTLQLREINAAVYGAGTVFLPDYAVATPTAPPPAVGAPAGGQWTLAAATTTGSGVVAPLLRVTGSASDDTSAEAIVIEYWKYDGVINPVATPDTPPWTIAGTYSPVTTTVEITGVAGSATYYAAVTYLVSGGRGERRVLGPVTVAATDISGQIAALLDTDGTMAANSDFVAASQKATRTYVAAAVAAAGGQWKYPVRFKTTANVNLAGGGLANGTTHDGVTAVTGDRVLVGSQTTGPENGFYIVPASGAPTRAPDADAGSELVNAAVLVSEGTANADKLFVCTTNAPITVNTTALTFVNPFGGLGGGDLLSTNNLSDLASAATARTNLGVRAAAPSIQSVTSAATVTPTFADDQVNITAQAAALALANPTGTAVDGWGISIRIKDNATARAISYGTQYRALGVTLPTTTVASKLLYLVLVYNAADTKWDVVAVAQEA